MTAQAPRYVSQPDAYWPADRVRPIVQAALDRLEAERPNDLSSSPEGYFGEFAGTHEVLSDEAGVSLRWVGALLAGKKDSVDARKTDAVFLALDLGHYFYLEPEDGGLRDLYYGEAA